MKKYMKPSINIQLLFSDCTICAGSPGVTGSDLPKADTNGKDKITEGDASEAYAKGEEDFIIDYNVWKSWDEN